MSLRMDADPARRGFRRRPDPARIFLEPSEQEDERVFFDPDAELTDERIEAVVEHLSDLKERREWDEFIPLANTALVFPRVQERISAEFFDDEIFEQIKNTIDLVDSHHRWKAASSLIFLHKYYPHKASQLGREEEVVLTHLQEESIEFEDREMFLGAYEFRYPFILLAPEKRQEIPVSEHFSLTKKEFEDSMNAYLEGVTEDPKNFDDFTRAAAYNLLRSGYIAACDDRYAAEPFIDKRLMKKIQFIPEHLAEKGDWKSFFNYVFGLTLATAERITIPSPGNIEFVLPQRKLASKPELPRQQEYS